MSMAATARAPEVVSAPPVPAHEAVVRLFIATAFAFLLISAALGAVDTNHATALMQLHAHLQVFGFAAPLAFAAGFAWLRAPVQSSARLIWAFWSSGILIRCLAHGRLTLFASVVLELAALLLFVGYATRSGALRGIPPSPPTFLVLGAALCLLIALVIAAVSALRVPRDVAGFPPSPAQRLVLLSTWGFMGPLAWAASARWLTGLLGLKPLKTKILIAACVLDGVGIAAAIAGRIHFAAVLLLHAAIFVPSSLKVFGRSQRTPQVNHPAFVRVAFGWLRIAATLGVWASVHDSAPLWSASRHAMTVGFVVVLALATADWWLPQLLFSRQEGPPGRSPALQNLHRTSLLVLNLGVGSYLTGEILLHEGSRFGATAMTAATILEFLALTALVLSYVASFVRVPAPADALEVVD